METKTFTEFLKENIRELKQEGRYGTAYVYLYTLKAMTVFAKTDTLLFKDITREKMIKFQKHLRDRQLSWNTVSTYARVIRATYNRAVDEGLIKGEYRLFSGIYTGVKTSRKLALESQEMKILTEGNPGIKLSHELKRAQDAFTLMTSLQGMPFVDLVHLKREDLKRDNRNGAFITCLRQKTGTELNIAVLPKVAKLIERNRSKNEHSPYLLDFLSGCQTGEMEFYEYRKLLYKTNYQLAKLAKLYGMNVHVSTYTPRHTWGTLAKYCQVPEEIISEGLGHSSLEVTRTYLKSFQGGELDKANKLIYNYIRTGRKIIWR